MNLFDLEKLSRTLVEERRRRNLRLEDAAIDSGISKPTLCKLENVDVGYRFSVETISALIIWLGISPSYFLKDEDKTLPVSGLMVIRDDLKDGKQIDKEVRRLLLEVTTLLIEE